jgi:hypothetical protein
VAVDPDLGVGHHAVELDKHAAGGGGGGERKTFPIPAHARGAVAATSTNGRVLFGDAFDRPVVRDVERAPVGVVEHRFKRSGRFAAREEPIGVEWLDRARAIGGGGGGGERNESGGE